MSCLAPRSRKEGKNSQTEAQSTLAEEENKHAFEQIYREYKENTKKNKQQVTFQNVLNWEEILPPQGRFKAKFLGLNFFGRLVVQHEDKELPLQQLRKCLVEFYGSDTTRDQYRIPPPQIRVGLLVCYFISGECGRAEVKYVDIVLRFCSVEDIDTSEYHAVGFDNIFWLDESWQCIPRKAIECDLKGLEDFDKRAVRDAFAKIKLTSQQVYATVENTVGPNGYPVVSIVTREDHQNLRDLLRNVLDPPKSTQNDEALAEIKVKKPLMNFQTAEAYEEGRRDVKRFFEGYSSTEGIPLKKVYGRVTTASGRPISWQKMGFSHWYIFLYHCSKYFYLKANRPDKTGIFLVFASKIPKNSSNPPGFQLVGFELLLALIPDELLKSIVETTESKASGSKILPTPLSQDQKASSNDLSGETREAMAESNPETKCFGDLDSTIRASVVADSAPANRSSGAFVDAFTVGMGHSIEYTLTQEETPYIFWTDPSQEIVIPPPPHWNEKPWKLLKRNVFQKTAAGTSTESEPRKLKYVGMPAIEKFDFPSTSPFKATLLGADSYGFMHIEVEDFMLKVHYKDLESSMNEFYGAAENRNACLLQSSDIKVLDCSTMMAIRRKGKYIRARVFEVDVGQQLCIVVGTEDPEFSFASFDEIYRLDPRFGYLPAKVGRAKMCILNGLEQHILTDHVADAIEKTPLCPSLVVVNIVVAKDENFGLPSVSMTWNGQDFYSLLRERAGKLLDTVTPEDMETRVTEQVRILQHLKERRYLPAV